ncbi:MAG: ATP-binding protein [Aliarcobacter sp.]|nr:ATP-binding protein [Aliarcobacter sp.]
MLEEIKIARETGTYTNLLKKYSRFEVLILDDFVTSTITTDDATNLFEIIKDRTFLYKHLLQKCFLFFHPYKILSMKYCK